MPELHLERFLAACSVDPAVLELRPDYRALLLAVDGLAPAPREARSDAADAGGSGVDALVREAEDRARELLAGSAVEELPHIAAWREAYRAFGAKPQRTRNSLEALTRRAMQGLPRVNALTDLYNAISVLHQIPVGGEDLHRYAGAARLVRAAGEEPFDTVTNGEAAIEHPDPGEVVWCDDAGVTCRRWNWRQGRRTALTDDTRAALFIFDALAPVTDTELDEAADALARQLYPLGADVRTARRVIGVR